MKINCKTCLNATGTNRSEPHHTINPVSDDRCSLLKACSHRPLCLRVRSRPDVTRVRCCVGLCSLPHTSCFSCPTEAAHRQSQSPMEFIHEGESPNFSASPSAASEGHGETHSLGGRPPRSSGQRVTPGDCLSPRRCFTSVIGDEERSEGDTEKSHSGLRVRFQLSSAADVTKNGEKRRGFGKARI